MKKFLMMLLFLCLTFPVYSFALDVNDNAPDFHGIAIDGKNITYSNIKYRKPVYLIFWATW